MEQYDIAIILGSKSDLDIVKKSNISQTFDFVGARYKVSIISAHRNLGELEQYVDGALSSGVAVFIAVAGMAAALPGTIDAIFNKLGEWRPVIGVPLPTTAYPDALDALLAIIRLPAGTPAAVCGIGEPGLQNAALLACQIIALNNSGVDQGLTNYMRIAADKKKAEYDIDLKE